MKGNIKEKIHKFMNHLIEKLDKITNSDQIESIKEISSNIDQASYPNLFSLKNYILILIVHFIKIESLVRLL
jgi:hypothetical protein